MKNCGRCGIEKNEKNSWKDQYYCKHCLKELKREWRNKWKSTSEGQRKITIDNLYSNAKTRAKRKNIEFSVTKNDISYLFGESCPIFGWEFILCSGKAYSESPSLDRKDNSIGYTKTNIRVISKKANAIKRDGNLKEFLAIQKYMQENLT